MGDRAYNDAHYQVEQIVCFPGTADLSAAAGNVAKIAFQEAIEVVEFGVVAVDEAVSGGGINRMELREGATVLATATMPSGSAMGVLATTRTVTANALAAGGDLIFYRNTTTAGAGVLAGYVKFKYRFA